MDSDLFEYLEASSHGTLDMLPPISWKKQSAVCVVLASSGYPDSYQKNEKILGLDKIPESDAMVFHAGTRQENGDILTSGGRVLGVTALGDTLQDAISGAYLAVDKIEWKSKFYRKDIGKKGLRYL
jgi:phosphoribosylamine--glycine ligase